jgi:hypothetical protein
MTVGVRPAHAGPTRLNVLNGRLVGDPVVVTLCETYENDLPGW